MRKHSSTELGSHRNWYAASESNTSCLGVDQMHTASLLAAYKKLVSRPGFGPGPDGLRGHYAAVTPATHRKFGGARRIRTFSRRFKRPLCYPLTLARHNWLLYTPASIEDVYSSKPRTRQVLLELPRPIPRCCQSGVPSLE